MWGNDQNVHALFGAAETGPVFNQLMKVSYGRPETWSFLLGMQVTGMQGTDFTGSIINVRYNLSVGVGRAVLQIPDWVVLTAEGDARGIVLWTTSASNRTQYQVSGPGVFTTTATLDTIVAENIQLYAAVDFGGGGTADFADVNVQAHFAPRTHVRPEWFDEEPTFSGNENKGT